MKTGSLIDKFLAHHRRVNTAATVKYYTTGLRWLRSKHGETLWKDLDREQLVEDLDAFNSRPQGGYWKEDTLRRNFNSIDQLQKYALEAYDLDPILRPKDLTKPPGNKREEIPTEEELEKLLSVPSKALALAFKSLAQSGMRPNELVGATIADLSPGRDLLILANHKTKKKAGKKRIPLGDTMQELVAEAIGDRTTGPNWLDEKGNAWTTGKLSRHFRVTKTRLGLNPQLVLYSLRHYKGTIVARKHGIHAAMHILGHRQITTTQRYAHLSDDDARKWQE